MAQENAPRTLRACASMIETPDSPRQLTRQWGILLLAPAAWVAALGILFALTADACTADTRVPMWAVFVNCILAAAVCAPFAWQARRLPGEANRAERMRSMIEKVIGMSAIISVALMIAAVPVLMLASCRS